METVEGVVSFLTLEEMLSIFPRNDDYIFIVQPLLCWGAFLLLSWRNVKFCQRLFLCLLMIMWFLSLILFLYCITFIDLHILNYPCILGMKPTWSWCMIFWMCYWIQFASMLLRSFASVFIKVIVCNFLWGTGAWSQGLHLEPLHQPYFIVEGFSR
jgi:hypothetical protein